MPIASDNARIFSLLWSIGRHMRDESPAGKRRFSMLHFQTLRYVKENGRPFMQDIARHLCVTPSAATLLVEGLTNEGLVSRSFDRKDRRIVRLSVTRAGERFIAKGIKAKMQKLAKLFAALTPKERAALIAILEKIAAAAGVS